MSSVAAQLGVRSQTLYHHVSGVGDIVDAARSVCVARISLSSLDSTILFTEGIHTFSRDYAEAFRPLARNIWTFFQHPIRDPATITMYESFMQRATSAGLPEDRALTLLLDVEYAVFMSVFEFDALQSILDRRALLGQGAEMLARSVARMPSGTLAGLHERLATRVTGALSEAEKP